MINNFSFALVNETKLIRNVSSPISPSTSISFPSKIDDVITSMNLIEAEGNDGT